MANVAPSAEVSRAHALYVGDLHPDVADANLFEHFSAIGKVTSVHVCRDNTSRCSLGYGYVNYASEQDAINAIEKLNHSVLFGKPIRIMWSNRDSNERKSGVGNVFVKNLGDSIDNIKLQEMFGKFGNILSAKLVIQNEKCKGYGFVQFDSQDSAKAAIEELNGTTVDGKKIYVGNFINKSERILHNREANYANLFIKNLDQDITEELVELKFSEYGKIVNVKIAKDEAGNSKGFGFVNFENPESARMAIEAMNGLQLGSKALYVSWAQTKEERLQNLPLMIEDKQNERIRRTMTSNLYVKNLDDSVDDNVLWEYFRQCGIITSTKVMLDEAGISKGFGFVCYSTPEEAKNAVKTLHGRIFRGKPLYVAIAQRKEERQAKLRLQQAQRMGALVAQATATIPTVYTSLYSSPPGVMPQIPPQGLVYQPFDLRPGFQPSGFVPPSSPNFQPTPFSVISNFQIPNTIIQQSQNRGRRNGNFSPQHGQFKQYMPQLQQPNYSLNSLKDAKGQQTMYQQNRRQGDMTNVPLSLSASSNPQEMQSLSSRLAAAPLPQQKQMLGERLFPLVQKHKANLASKITGMLLEMDNSELLLLLESPKSLAAKVEEAFEVLEFSKSDRSENSSS